MGCYRGERAMLRNTRQAKILEMIDEKVIETQEDLAASLHKAGCQITQATISRDIKELGLIKVTLSDGRQKYARNQTDTRLDHKVLALFQQAVLSIDYAINLVVIKTLSGSANAAGLMVDRLKKPEVLGCVAGDDTVLVITRSEMAAEKLVYLLNDMLDS